MEKRTYIGELSKHVGETVTIAGWVDVRRDQGKMIFFDFRDMTGYVQGVVLPGATEAHEVGSKVRGEWVVEVTGKVNKRPEKNVQPDKQNGDVELEILSINVLNEAEALPIDVSGDGLEISEDVRLKYRYLDLRRPRLQKNIRTRDKIITFFRDYMHKNDFVEIETPMLMKGTPEGSREYLVPSRLEKGMFYALPQSPQQFKQLSMVAGFEKYFQIARCMRDEDLRGDRQPEFTQLDFEMSFVDQEDILSFTEPMFIEMVKTLFPEKTISQIPFPRITFKESMEKYGSDKPDLRKDKNDANELAFAWIVDFPMFEKDKEGNIQAAHHPFCSINDEDVDKFMKDEDLLSIRAKSYDLVLNGYELSSGSIRIHKSDMQQKVFELLNISHEEQQKKFVHMLEAFKYGAPPHGGFAPGIDRIAMLLLGEPNIREVIAFPKTGEGKDLMMSAPSSASAQQLEELGLSLRPDARNNETNTEHMIIYIAGDHRGFYLKETLKEALKKEAFEVIDVGNPESAPDDDYPNFAAAVAEKVSGTGDQARGIVICGSGFGVDIVANKFPGVRSALAMSADHIRTGRHDDDVNVVALASDLIQPDVALDIVHAFLSTPFDKEDRYERRLDEIKKIEEKNK